MDERFGSLAVSDNQHEICTTTPDLMSRLLLNRDQVAALLEVDPATVDYLHRMRRLRAVRVGKVNRWKPADVKAYVESLSPSETD
jgi:hypothetical protein